MDSPFGEQVGLVREFLEGWYALFYDQRRNRRAPEEAKDRYERLRRDARYRMLKPLARLQERNTSARSQVSYVLQSGKRPTMVPSAVPELSVTYRSPIQLQEVAVHRRRHQSQGVLYKVESTVAQSPPPGRCARGRKTLRTAGMPAAA